MSAREELEALADRVEMLAGPDREVDGLIAAALGLPHGPSSGWNNSENGDYWTVEECAPSYTASIDDAMTLVPEGYDWSVSSEQGRGIAYCVQGPSAFLPDCVAATPALALCAAALRAKASCL